MLRGAGRVGTALPLPALGWHSVCLSIPALAPSGFLSLLLLFLLGRLLALCVSLTLGFVLGLWFFLRWSGRGCLGRGRGRRTWWHYDLVLALSIGDDCAQKKGDDGHKVEVPLWTQKLIQVHLRNQLFQLREGERQRHI